MDIEVYCEKDTETEDRVYYWADGLSLRMNKNEFNGFGAPDAVYVRVGTDRSGERDGPLREWPKPAQV